MKEFKDKVAVITGAASGIGYGIAKRAIREGMKVVMADIEEEALASAEDKLKKLGENIIAVPTDVSKANNLERLAQKTLDSFGKVHLLFNNAGVIIKGVLWEATLAEWEWILNVNLWSVIHGIRTFIPIMLKQNEECHIINTASTAGLISTQYEGIYALTKFGIVSLSETLSNELTALKSKIKVSVLCPGLVKTHLIEPKSRSPKNIIHHNINFKNSVESLLRTHPEAETWMNLWMDWWENGISPEIVGEVVFKAIKDQTFYILTDTSPGLKNMIEGRFKRILNEFERNQKYLE
ncbi:MAG: SDR family NAD(P)-dependent oxidoreductase [Candidatus Thorarchaeota archaeon]